MLVSGGCERLSQFLDAIANGSSRDAELAGGLADVARHQQSADLFDLRRQAGKDLLNVHLQIEMRGVVVLDAVRGNGFVLAPQQIFDRLRFRRFEFAASLLSIARALERDRRPVQRAIDTIRERFTEAGLGAEESC